jgi:hypothetical protein
MLPLSKVEKASSQTVFRPMAGTAKKEPESPLATAVLKLLDRSTILMLIVTVYALFGDDLYVPLLPFSPKTVVL